MYLYIVMASNGLFKIGKASNIKTRIAQIKSASPVEVELFTLIEYDDDEIDLEGQIHSQYSKKRVRGEWFALSKNDLITIIRSPSKELISLLNEMQSWGFFHLGTMELLGGVAQVALWRVHALLQPDDINGLDLFQSTIWPSSDKVKPEQMGMELA